MPKFGPISALVALTCLAACATTGGPVPVASATPAGPGASSAAPASPQATTSPAASPMVGAYAPVAGDEARLVGAVEAGVSQLRSSAWLADADLTAGPIVAGERQVVAGTNHRATLRLSRGGQQRLARLWIFEDLAGARQLTAVDLGPVGSEAPLLEVPTPSDLPGGWSDQPADDPAVRVTADQALALLSGADWLRRPVTLVRITRARTQVVAGLNTYLALDVEVDGVTRRVDTIVYEPLAGSATLSLVRLSALPPS